MRACSPHHAFSVDVALTDESRDGDSSSAACLGKVLWSPTDFTVWKYFLLHNINCLFQFNPVVLNYITKVLPWVKPLFWATSLQWGNQYCKRPQVVKSLQEGGMSTSFPSPFLRLAQAQDEQVLLCSSLEVQVCASSKPWARSFSPTVAAEISRRHLPLLVASDGSGGPFLCAAFLCLS